MRLEMGPGTSQEGNARLGTGRMRHPVWAGQWGTVGWVEEQGEGETRLGDGTRCARGLGGGGREGEATGERRDSEEKWEGPDTGRGMVVTRVMGARRRHEWVHTMSKP